MRITNLDVIVTAPPAPGWGGRYWILVKVTTNTNVVGWGECYASSVGPKAMTTVIEDVFERYFLDFYNMEIKEEATKVFNNEREKDSHYIVAIENNEI